MCLESLLAQLIALQQRVYFWKRQLQLAPSERLSVSPERYLEHYEQQVSKLESLIAEKNREGAVSSKESVRRFATRR